MTGFTKAFIASALFFAALGSILGVLCFAAMAGLVPAGSIYIYPLMVSAIHSFLLGFFTMMIFGVTYHIIPMFAGKGFYSPVLAYLHLALSNIGVLGIIIFLLASPFYPTDIHPVARASAVMEALSLFIFLYNMMLTFIKGIPGTGVPNPFGSTDKETDLAATMYTSSSMIYFLIGCMLGAFMFLRPGNIYTVMPAHAHINLVGFVSMMIFGVSYHMFPRFADRPIYSISIVKKQFYLTNLGLIGMVSLFLFSERSGMVYRSLMPIFGTVLAVSFFLYLFNSWKTISRR